jgi:hypothetical protein
MLGLSLFGGGIEPVHQAEDHRCDGGGADGGGLGRAGPRLKVLEAIDNLRINAALAP